MKTRTLLVLAGAAFFTAHAPAQSVLFDFDTAPLHSSLPLDLTASGITAHFSATGQGFSVQWANALGFTPAGFSGFCLYPNGVFASDLLLAFSEPLTDLSILYAPQELGCDDSARMKITAYLDGALVGTNLATAANPGTWPSETLSFSSARTFNRVEIHYDARPPTCRDWGPIFMADNLRVTPAPPPIVLTDAITLPDGAFQFGFTNTPGRSFSVFSITSLSGPFTNWILLGSVTEVAPGQFQFTDAEATNSPGRLYRVRSP